MSGSNTSSRDVAETYGMSVQSVKPVPREVNSSPMLADDNRVRPSALDELRGRLSSMQNRNTWATTTNYFEEKYRMNSLPGDENSVSLRQHSSVVTALEDRLTGTIAAYEQLEAKLILETRHCEKVEMRFKELQAKYIGFEEDNMGLQTALDAANCTIKKQEKIIVKLKSTNNALELDNNALQDELSSAQATLTHKFHSSSPVRVSVALDNAIADIDEMSCSRALLEQRVAQLNCDNSSLHHTINELKGELLNAKQAKESIREMHQQQSERLSDMSRRYF
jgi:chromosome segregation ATPase